MRSKTGRLFMSGYRSHQGSTFKPERNLRGCVGIFMVTAHNRDWCLESKHFTGTYTGRIRDTDIIHYAAIEAFLLLLLALKKKKGSQDEMSYVYCK
jgi:hypothetical protein